MNDEMKVYEVEFTDRLVVDGFTIEDAQRTAIEEYIQRLQQVLMGRSFQATISIEEIGDYNVI